MAYTAIDEVRNLLQKKYKDAGTGPISPKEIKEEVGQRVDFETAVRHFVHERCAGLRFDAQLAQAETKTGVLRGKSKKDGQIPYNMQMDIDRLCLARAIERFMASGEKEDAFDVYFCYLEMFGGGYNCSRRMIELLSEYESTASNLLMAHRDHYSHSVYVFLLGLAMYDAMAVVREEYKRFYAINDETVAAHHFLQFWGMTSLFHDIGYPFEISFQQVKAYFSQRNIESNKPKDVQGVPFVCFGNMDEYIRIDQRAKDKLKEWYNQDFDTIEQWLAYDIEKLIQRSGCQRLKQTTQADIMNILKGIARPEIDEKKYMDHAYFSTIILFKELFETLAGEGSKTLLKKEHMDALTAIALHNSLYKRKITRDEGLKDADHAFKLEWHPLAYVLQLTDELQCWDRTSYGRNTRSQLHPMACDLSFDNSGVYAEYVFDMAESKKIIDYWTRYEEYKNKKLEQKPRLKKYSDMTHENPFAQEIGLIVDLSNYGSCEGRFALEVTQKVEKANWQNKHVYLSTCNFLHLYEFAAALNAQYNKEYMPDKDMLNDFDHLSLEYKLSNIGMAKYFANILDEIGCFYTDKPVAYEMVTGFSEKEIMRLGDYEHKRWMQEKKDMFWLPGDGMATELKANENERRELSRTHYDLGVEYNKLSDEEKSKDYNHLNIMIEKLMEFDGIRVYRYK